MRFSIDVISSALNEEDAIIELYERLHKVFLSETNYKWNFIIFDNGSSDSTWSKIVNLSENNDNVVGYRMSRTFSLDAAFTAGLLEATSDVAVIMASDLQDPPEIIPLLLRKWETGVPHVVVRVLKRQEMSHLRKLLTFAHYKISSWATDGVIPENVSDFRLMDKVVYTSVNQLQEKNRYLRGIIAWTGFPTEYINIERPARYSGKTKTKYADLISFSIKGIFAYSNKPITYISTIGLLMSIVSMTTLVLFASAWIFFGVPFAGFGTIVGLIILTFSITLSLFGVLAEYISLIYNEVRSRPHSIIWEKTRNRRP